MKKNLLVFLRTLLFAAMVPSLSLILVSCDPESGNEDDGSTSGATPELSVKTALIGAWNTSMESSNWQSINIEPNGTMKYGYMSAEELEEKGYVFDEEEGVYEKVDGMYRVTYNPLSNAYWAFDEVSHTISMYTENGYYAFTYKVIMNDDYNSWAGVNLISGKTYSFVKKHE